MVRSLRSRTVKFYKEKIVELNINKATTADSVNTVLNNMFWINADKVPPAVGDSYY